MLMVHMGLGCAIVLQAAKHGNGLPGRKHTAAAPGL